MKCVSCILTLTFLDLSRIAKNIHFSPVHDAVRFCELRTLHRVLLELHVRAVGVFAPELPGLVAAQFFRRHFHAMFQQFFAQGVNVVHLETKMVDALMFDFRRRVGSENLDELTGRDLEIKSKKFSVLVKIEMRFQAERAAVKVAAAFEVFGKNAEMREGFDHNDVGTNYKIPRAESNRRNEIFSPRRRDNLQRKNSREQFYSRELVSPPNQFTEISICFGLASSVFGSVTVSTPSLYWALILSAATGVGSVRARWNFP